MTLPQSIEAEQSVLGSVMRDPASLPLVSDWLAETDFLRAGHRTVYRTLLAMAEAGKPLDVVTVGEALDAIGERELSGEVIGLAMTQGSAANIVAHAEIVVEKSRLRSLIGLGAKLQNAEGASGEIAMRAQTALARMAPTRRTGLLPTKPLLRNWFADLQRRYEDKHLPGLPYPWHALNKLTHGMQDGEVTVLAARPGTGKSALAFQIAAFTAMRNDRTALFALEMTTDQVMRRCVSCLGDVPHDWLLEPRDEDGDHWPNVTNAVRDLSRAALHVDDSPQLSSIEISARAQRMHLQAPIRLIVVDHLHEMKLAGKSGEVTERGDALRDLKGLAKRLNCPALVLAQLNRGSETDNRRPTMRDLRASGGIEEVADVVLFPYRDPANTDAIEIIVGKGRDLKKGAPIFLKDRFDCMRAEDWDGPLPQREVTPIRRYRGFAGPGRDRASGES